MCAERPISFRAAEAERIIGEDPDIAEAGLQVLVRGDRVYVHGCASGPARAARAIQVVRAAFPGYHVVDETRVAVEPEPKHASSGPSSDAP